MVGNRAFLSSLSVSYFSIYYGLVDALEDGTSWMSWSGFRHRVVVGYGGAGVQVSQAEDGVWKGVEWY